MDILTGLLLTIQIFVAFALIAIVLIQQTDNSGLGLAGSSGGGDAGSLLQTRASASFLTRATSVLAAAFILVSLVQGIVAGGYGSEGGFISNTLGLTDPAALQDNSINANPLFSDDSLGGGTDSSNLLFDPTISLDDTATEDAAPAADEATDSQ